MEPATHVPSIMIVAGEASADMHGADIVRSLQQQQPHLQMFGMGGAMMRAAGFEALIPAEHMSVAGITEVIRALPRLYGYLKTLQQAAAIRQPHAVILIDLPDFNLRLARHLKKLGIPVIYYISPQIWAWRTHRVHLIRQYVDKMLVILPFEEAFYKQYHVPVQFVGHPLIEQLPSKIDKPAAKYALGLQDHLGPIVAILPGSRMQEMKRHLPAMLQAVAKMAQTTPNLQCILPVASTISVAWVQQMLQHNTLPIRVVSGQSTEALMAADIAVVCSGTATLQAALLACPMVVVYRVSWLTYIILKKLIKVAHIALVNLIAGERLVVELMQHAFTAEHLAEELLTLLNNKSRQHYLRERFAMLRTQLGQGHTADNVVQAILTYIPKGNSIHES